MSSRVESPSNRGSSNKSSLQEKLGTVFYSIGLLCSSYPTSILTFAIVVIIGCCLPLVNIPLPLTSPKQEWVATNNITQDYAPFCYVQQVVLKVTVLPWEADLTLGDGFRAPLYESFKLLDIVRNYEDKSSSKTLGHVCLHIEAVAKSKTSDVPTLMPQYSCLVLSPANFWHQDVNEFSQDSTILTTIFNQHRYHKGKVSMAEILFGIPLRDTGIKRYPLRHRQRIIQFAITLFYKDFDKGFVEGLQEKLATLYPLHQTKTPSALINDTLIINYPSEIDYFELAPIIIAFFLLFLYYYFYVRKMDEIKSKFGMSCTATVTVLCSLLMTMGICVIFGLGMNNQRAKWIFPYLAVLFGLENVLVITKSVLTTPQHLDAKIRVAQGLSKEGWCTTKNILIEITVFTFGLFTFVPVIQEFCVFALVSLIAGLFLQIFFFSTVLGVDLNRASTSLEKSGQGLRNALYKPLIESGRGMSRSRSHPRLSFPSNIVVASPNNTQEKKIPKRLKIVNLWTRTRLFQRSFMVLMVVWIFMIICNSDIINHYFLTSLNESRHNRTSGSPSSTTKPQNYLNLNFFPLFERSNLTTKQSSVNYVTYTPLETGESSVNHSIEVDKLKPGEYAPALKLPASHWSGILRKYNVSLSGRSVAILPSIKLAHVISPEQAVLLRNPDEKFSTSKLQWQALALALDPIDFNGDDFPLIDQMEQPLYPRSPMEIMLLSILILISIVVMTYGFVVLYRCICSRNYAEWRASWYPDKSEDPVEPSEQVMLEAVPVVLEGHNQEVECLATDGNHLASICLSGQLKIWDNNNGELISVVDRKSYFSQQSTESDNLENDDLSDYESGSSPSQDDVYPRLVNRINTDFSNLKFRASSGADNPFNAKYEFYKAYKFHYIQDNKPNIRRSRSDQKRMKISDEGSGKLSAVWCMDFVDNLVIIGCANGRLEFWEATTSRLKCLFEDGNDSGVTHVKLIGSRVIATRLCGSIDFLQLQTYTQGRPVDWNFSCAYRRTHIRTGSMGSISEREIHHSNQVLVNSTSKNDIRTLFTLKDYSELHYNIKFEK